MNNHGTILAILPADRGVILTRLVLAFGILIVLAFLLFWRAPQAFPFILSFWVMFSLYTLYPLVRLLLSGEAILVMDEGIVDRTGALDFVRWSEIRGVCVRPYMGLK